MWADARFGCLAAQTSCARGLVPAVLSSSPWVRRPGASAAATPAKAGRHRQATWQRLHQAQTLSSHCIRRSEAHQDVRIDACDFIRSVQSDARAIRQFQDGAAVAQRRGRADHCRGLVVLQDGREFLGRRTGIRVDEHQQRAVPYRLLEVIFRRAGDKRSPALRSERCRVSLGQDARRIEVVAQPFAIGTVAGPEGRRPTGSGARCRRRARRSGRRTWWLCLLRVGNPGQQSDQQTSGCKRCPRALRTPCRRRTPARPHTPASSPAPRWCAPAPCSRRSRRPHRP